MPVAHTRRPTSGRSGVKPALHRLVHGGSTGRPLVRCLAWRGVHGQVGGADWSSTYGARVRSVDLAL